MTVRLGLLNRLSDIRARSEHARIAVDSAGVNALLPQIPADQLPTRRDLLLQGLLHLPRIAAPDGTIGVPEAISELERLAGFRREELQPYVALAAAPSRIPGVGELDVQTVAPDTAEPILSHFHYLRSFRPSSVSLAALYGRRVVALCAVSPFDLPHVEPKLPLVTPDEVAVVSRVFAFDWAPKNTISYLLARIGQHVGARLLLTYLNPNMGFTGASYRAANWKLLGIETGTRYAYLAERYITDRDIAMLSPSAQRQVEYSRMPLRPLELYGRVLDRKLLASLGERPFVVERAVHAARSL